MKRLMIIGAFAIAALLTSCDTNKAQCWKITVTYTEGNKTEYLFWGTGDESDAQLDTFKEAIALGAVKSVSKEQTFLPQSDCKLLQ